MNIRSLTVLALCAGIPMLAQTPGLTAAKGDTEVTVYGILDVGVGTVAHSFGFDPNFPVGVNPQAIKFADTSATGMFNGGISQTRWGIKGSTGLTDGWKAVFTLEGAINVPSGAVSNGALGLSQNYASSATVASSGTSADTAINGQLFSRGAYFGISSDTYGTLTAGRHMSFMLETIPGYDALQGAQIFTPIGFSGSYGGGGATDSSRVDNALRYKLKVGDVNVALMHKFGGATGSSTARSANEFQLGYEHGPFGIQFIYQKFEDTTSVANNETVTKTTSTTLNTSGLPLQAGDTPMVTYAVTANQGTVKVTYYDTTSIMLAARYQIGHLGIKAGYTKEQFTNPSNPVLDANTTSIYGINVSAVSVTPYTIAQYTNASEVVVPGTTVEKDITVYWLGAVYDFTPKLSFALGYYNVKQNDFSNGNAALTADVSGTSKFTSALLDYKWTKAFDVYAGYMKNDVSGGLAAGYLHTDNNIMGFGARFKF